MNKISSFLLTIGLLAGAIIGAGMFSLPFIFQSAGWGLGFFWLALAAVVYILIHLMYADVILRTPETHRFVGYAGAYLGQKYFWLAILMTVVEMIFVLAIYLVLSQSFSDLFITAGSVFDKLLFFWLLGSMAIFLPLKRMALLQFTMTGGIVLVAILIFFFSLPQWSNLASTTWSYDMTKFLLPLAPILFALSGRVAIPSVINFARERGQGASFIKQVIIWGTIVSAAVYALFVVAVIALSGNVSADAVSGLIGHVPVIALPIIGVLGILSLFSSYILVGLDVASILYYDLKMPLWLRLGIVVGGPLALYLLGFQSFIALVALVGGVFLALEGIFILAVWLKANKTLPKPSLLLPSVGWPLIGILFLVFIVALVYELVK